MEDTGAMMGEMGKGMFNLDVGWEGNTNEQGRKRSK